MEQMNDHQQATETEQQLTAIVEEARRIVEEQAKKLNDANATFASAQSQLAKTRAAAQHTQALMEEKQKAQQVEQRLTALVEEAQTLVTKSVNDLYHAVERAENLLAEARAIAHEFNLTTGKTLVFDENFSLPIRGLAASYWLNQNIPSEYVRVHGKTVPERGRHMQLRDGVTYKDYPQRCSVAVSDLEADKLLRRSVAYPVA